MISARRQRGQILILLGAWLFFGGGASSALIAYDRPVSKVEKSVKRVISDSGRKEAILTSIKNWESAQKVRDKIVSANRKALLDMLRRQDALPAEADALAAKLDISFGAMDQDFLALRFRVRQLVTRSEWPGIVAQPSQ